MSFTTIVNELRDTIVYNREALAIFLNKNPSIAFQKINELALFVGSRHNVDLRVHFPVARKINDFDSLGMENIGIVFDKFKKTFPIDRESIKQKAMIIFSKANAQDAYMYEGKEGVRITIDKGRLEVLPGSLHLWCSIDQDVKRYCDWLFENIYIFNKK